MRQKIDTVFNHLDEKPLFYIESGSRLWGIASPDSDYDVRGFHLQSKQQYFDFKEHPDIIEIMDGDFDFVSYDIDKMFGLLAKSNPTVLEWLRGHIIYYNVLPDWTKIQNDIIENFDFKALFYHYLSLSKGNISLMETGKKFTYKTVFYCIRGLLSAELSYNHVMPELLIYDLFQQFKKGNDILTIAKESLEIKKQQKEKQEVSSSEKEGILNAIKLFTSHLENKSPESSNDRQRLGAILRDYCFTIKEEYYK